MFYFAHSRPMLTLHSFLHVFEIFVDALNKADSIFLCESEMIDLIKTLLSCRIF